MLHAVFYTVVLEQKLAGITLWDYLWQITSDRLTASLTSSDHIMTYAATVIL